MAVFIHRRHAARGDVRATNFPGGVWSVGMNEGFSELLAVLRCARFGTALSHAVTFARSGAADAVRAFDHVVTPLVDHTIMDSAVRGHVRGALLFASVKGSFLISSYSTMAGLAFRADLSVLGGSFARLYDDLIDDIDGVRLDARLADLFQGRPFNATTELERLLETLYHAIEERLDRPAGDPIYGALQGLHEFQVLSRRQKDPDISRESLAKITAGKGGLANVALFGLVRPGMGVFERELVMQLGETLQLLDDCVDFEVDRCSGITTAVTRGESTLAEVCRRLRGLRPRLLAFYGRAGGRQFVAVLYTLLVAAFLRRHRPKPYSLVPKMHEARSPLWILLHRGDGVVPRSGA